MINISEEYIDGLRSMMLDITDGDELVQVYVDPSTAAYIIEVIKRCPNRKDWFPYGKEFTLLSIKRNLNERIDQIVQSGLRHNCHNYD